MKITMTERLAKVKLPPAGILLPVMLLVGFLAQVSFGNPNNRTVGLTLLFVLIGVVGIFVWLESRQTTEKALTPPALDLSPGEPLDFTNLRAEPWRTLVGTLAFVAAAACMMQARDIDSNLVAAVLYLSSLILFAVAMLPYPLRIDRAQVTAALRKDWLYISAVAALLVVGVVARLSQLDKFPFGVEGDEGLFGSEAMRVMAGEKLLLFGTTWHFDHTASFTYLQVISMQLFGRNEIGLRTLAGVMGSFSLLFSYLLAKQMFGRGVGLISLALLAFAPYHLIFSRMGTHDMIVMLTYIPATLYFLYRGLTGRRYSDFGLAGLALGVGLWMDYNNKIMILIPLVVGIVGYVLLRNWRYWQTEYPKLALFAAGALITLLPLWSALIPINKLFQEPSRGKGLLSEENLAPMLARYETTSVPVVVLRQVEYSVLSLNTFGDVGFMHLLNGQHPFLDTLSAIFCFIGVAYCVWRWREPAFGILLLVWVVGFQMSIWTVNPPQFHRLTPIIIPSYILAAIGIYLIGHTWAKLLNWPSIYITAIITVLVGSIAYTNLRLFLTPELYQDRWLEFCETGKAIKSFQDANVEVVYMGQPYQDTRHGSIVFCSQLDSSETMNVDSAAAVAPFPTYATKDVAIIFSREHLADLDAVQDFYPTGTVGEMRNALGLVIAKTYLISKADVNTATQAQGTSP